MKIVLKIATFLVLLVHVCGQTTPPQREIVEVEIEEGLPNPDLSKTNLTTSYCETKDRECVGEDIEQQFAPTASQCLNRCNRNLSCLSAFYSNDKICHLRGGRCSLSQLAAKVGGTDLYRLLKGETCPSNRPLFQITSVKYSRKFCLWRGKACPGHNLYPKPQNTFPNMECLKKCAGINTCPGVDYYSTVPNCEPKNYACPDEELIDAPGTFNYIRLAEGVDFCPFNRVETPPVPTEPAETTVPPTQPTVPTEPTTLPSKPNVPAVPTVTPTKPAECQFFEELKQLMAKYPNGCPACP